MNQLRKVLFFGGIVGTVLAGVVIRSLGAVISRAKGV